MEYVLKITNITPYGYESLVELDNGERVLRSCVSAPKECSPYFCHKDVNSEVAATQYYGRSMLFALMDLEFNWALTSLSDQPRKDKYVRLDQLNSVPFLDDDFLHGEHGEQCVEGLIPSNMIDVAVQYKPDMYVIIGAKHIERYKGNMHLLARRIILEYLPTRIAVGVILNYGE